MSQQVTEDIAANLIVILSKDNVGVTGLADTDLTVEYRKDGDVGFTAKAIIPADLVEHGDGVYTLAFTALEMDTPGALTIKVQGALIDQSVTIVNVLAVGVVGAGTVALETCTLTGNVNDAAGQPVANAAVLAVVLGIPSIEQNSAVITNGRVSVKTDANGEFFLTLVRLADVEIFIPEANYRRTLVVPNQASANLFTGVA